MTGTTVSGNSAKENGGGVGDVGSGANLDGVGFLNNLVTLHGVAITSNTAGDAGGGIYSGGGGLTIDQKKVISNNTSVGAGGGLYVPIYSNSTNPSYNVSFSNITVTDNHTTAASQAYGGGDASLLSWQPLHPPVGWGSATHPPLMLRQETNLPGSPSPKPRVAFMPTS
jgi:hypothetical protein